MWRREQDWRAGGEGGAKRDVPAGADKQSLRRITGERISRLRQHVCAAEIDLSAASNTDVCESATRLSIMREAVKLVSANGPGDPGSVVIGNRTPTRHQAAQLSGPTVSGGDYPSHVLNFFKYLELVSAMYYVYDMTTRSPSSLFQVPRQAVILASA